MSTKEAFEPDWTEKPPKKGSYRSIFKWGAPNGFKHPNKRLFNLAKETFRLTDDDFNKKIKEGNDPVKLGEDQSIQLPQTSITQFIEIVGKENVETDDYSRLKYSTGKTMEEAYELRNQAPVKVSQIVVHPRNKEDVQAIVTYCNEQKIPIYPFGGGSSVTLGLRAEKGGITLVMSTHMNQLLELNETNQTATVQSGMMGPAYETLLNKAPQMLKAKRAYTCGHFPQSFEYSTVGGWILAKGSGQASSYYGDACDLIISQEYVTPIGSFKTLDYPGTATGPMVNDIMKGNEGSFGILVSATMKIFRYVPENRKRFSYIFPSWENAVNASREIFQGEFGNPSVFRISDPEETFIGLKQFGIEGTILDKWMIARGYKAMERCICLGHTEGEEDFSAFVRKKIKRICKAHGAMYLTSYPVKRWEHSRYEDPYIREDLHDYGVVIDTLETGVKWDNLHQVHQGVREFIKNRPQTLCMTHCSHFYPQGTNLYFIFIGKFDSQEDYKSFQTGIIDQMNKHGGSLSHHHGVGKMIGRWMESHLGKDQMDILRALKKHFDPNNIMNPGGTLGLD